MLGSGGTLASFTRYNWDGTNPQDAPFPDGQLTEGFDWVDDDTIISTCYFGTANKRRLYLTDVAADTFTLSTNTTWNAGGWVDTGVTTRIRNVRVGDAAPYSGYAYYGDAGQNTNPKFYAIDLATGAPTELGSLGALTGGGSFGLWTVVERKGYLYVQTTDNGIQVYGPMINATNKGPLYATYTKTEVDAITGIKTAEQYYGLDVSVDGKKLLLGAAFGNVFVLEPALHLSVSRSGTNIILSWPAYHTGVVVESSTTLESSGFADLSPQPAVAVVGDLNAFRFCIHQPKLYHYDEWTYTRGELESFMTLIRPVAKLSSPFFWELLQGLRTSTVSMVQQFLPFIEKPFLV